MGITQPTRKATRYRRAPIAGAMPVRGARNGASSGGSWRPERAMLVKPTAWAALVIEPKTRSRVGCATSWRSAVRANHRFGDGRRMRSTSARPASMIRP
jgi:hypothetical protein